MLKKIKKLDDGATLMRDDRTGIAAIHNGRDGINYTLHPSIDKTGSVRGMKKLGYWGKDDRVVRTGSYQYNIDHVVSTENEKYDKILKQECRCSACLMRRNEHQPSGR